MNQNPVSSVTGSEAENGGNGTAASSNRAIFLWTEDNLAILLAFAILALHVATAWWGRPVDFEHKLAELQATISAPALREVKPASHVAAGTGSVADAGEVIAGLKKSLSGQPLKPWFAKPGKWTASPIEALAGDKSSAWQGLIGGFLISLVAFGMGVRLRGQAFGPFAQAFLPLFLLAALGYLLAGQVVIAHYNLEYALWALVTGLVISNTLGTPSLLRPAIQTEFYIKTGLVLLGAEVLFNRLLALGVPGIFVAWVVTPIVLVSTYLFGQYVLKIPSRSLNMVISADMSVCGVSAAIATAAACRAKKEELSMAIGLSLAFTVIMMAVMPAAIGAMGMDPVLGGAWIGGTIDSTGAVAVAGELLGSQALEVATTVKMIQNILIGVVAFCVAVYWVTCVERGDRQVRPSVAEIWRRFPKFVLGFVAASLIFSFLATRSLAGELLVEAVVSSTKSLRGWFFCLAFVSIGLETNFRQLAVYLKGGKPLILYVCGQGLNLVLTLAMAYLMFRVVFPESGRVLGEG